MTKSDTTEEVAEVAEQEYAVRADRRRNRKRIQRAGIREVSCEVRRENFRGMTITSPSVNGGTRYVVGLNSIAWARSMAHRIDRHLVRQELAAIDTADLLEEIRKRGYKVVPTPQRKAARSLWRIRHAGCVHATLGGEDRYYHQKG